MGGRLGLGITTILTIMFLLGSVNMSLPRVSYPKAIDWFLIVSFLFVFLVLLECIIVYISRARKTDSKDDTDEKILDMKMVPIGDFQVREPKLIQQLKPTYVYFEVDFYVILLK